MIIWNYKTSRNNIQENPFIKVYWILGIHVLSRMRLAITENRNISRHQTTNLLKIWFLVLVSTKRKERNKSEYVTKFVGILITLVFKHLSQIPCKIFATQRLFFHWSLETQNRN